MVRQMNSNWYRRIACKQAKREQTRGSNGQTDQKLYQLKNIGHLGSRLQPWEDRSTTHSASLSTWAALDC